MEFRLLGPVELRAAERVLPLGGPRQRSVVAALAVDAGGPVPVEALIDRVWGHAPPPRVRHALHVYVSRLRRLLGQETAAGHPTRVVHRAGGYLLEVAPEEVDLRRFERLVESARDRGCPDPRRVALLRQALELWRGPPLDTLPGEWAARVRRGWQQRYLDAVLEWAQASLRVGEPSRVLARLAELTGEHPLVESLGAAYMRALYSAGRSADALAHYRTVRRLLAEELGTDPDPELGRLHRQILTADPALARPAVRPDPPPPRQLPAPLAGFAGRAAELARLDRTPPAGTAALVTIDGMPGVGKTALAVHAAHRIADRYPDGQLFLDLRGHTQGAAPVDPGQALDRMLRSLGVVAEWVPAQLDDRAALYRSRLAHRRLLLLLDNAVTDDQVAPLLPGTPGCLVLVTSRHRLTGLDPTHGVSLDPLPVPDAVSLFARLAGPLRLAREPPELLVEAVELCGRLPLAIRIAATRLRSHPSWRMRHLVDRLRDHRHRLAELALGGRSAAASFDLSYRRLSPDQQRAYRLLGLHPGPDLDPGGAAALLGTTVAGAGRLLEWLLDAHLLREPVPGRYEFPDLLRAHAASIAHRDEAAATRQAALGRLAAQQRRAGAAGLAAAESVGDPVRRGPGRAG